MKVLDLFSGIGGFSLGLEAAGMETVAFCEVDSSCQQRLSKQWKDIPIAGDITQLSFNGDGLYHEGVKIYEGTVDLICGGYPCQPFSVAGKRKGKEDARHLWPEMFRIIRSAKPEWVVCENVTGHIELGADEVISQLEAEGYSCWTFVLPACSVGAPHRRDRLWIIATRLPIMVNPNGDGCSKYQTTTPEEPEGGAEAASLPDGSGSLRDQWSRSSFNAEPGMARVADGISDQVDRIKALGNAIVPHIAFIIGLTIIRYRTCQKISSASR